MIFILAWYALGIIGLCLITYVDLKEGCSSKEHLLVYLYTAVLGLPVFCVGVYAMYCYKVGK